MVLLVAVCLAGGFLAFGLAWMTRYPDLAAVPGPDQGRVGGLIFADLALGLVACLLVPLVIGRRPRTSRAAGFAALAIIATTALSSLASVAYLLALATVASSRRPRWLAAGLGVGAAALAVADVVDPVTSDPVTSLVAGAIALAVPALAGLYLGSRRALLESYREQADSAQREQAALVSRARYAERTQIAREMHDTLSHRLALISLHAGALAYRPDSGSDKVEETARLIQQTAQTASEDMHTLLTLLRDDTHDTRLEPTLADLEATIESFRSSGLDVTLVLDAALRPRLAGLATLQSGALARGLAEGLANAAKHAPGAPVRVALNESEGGVRLTVRNGRPTEPPLPSGGFGLVGVRERLEVAGGHLATRPDGDGFVLEAWVPWT